MIIIKPIPGQETRNAEVMEDYQSGMRLINVDDITLQISELLADNASKLCQMRDNTKKIAKPKAAETVCKWVLEKIVCEK